MSHLCWHGGEAGGWQPGDLTTAVGEPLRLRLTSDDVVHGFAVGHSDTPAVDVKPGQVTDLSLRFDSAGTYTFYCTRWCGPDHWRMRGTIEVTGRAARPVSVLPPLYVTLGIDLDAPHTVDVRPQRVPSAVRGTSLGVTVPAEYIARDYVRSHSPLAAWQALRSDRRTARLSDAEVWDLVAVIWRLNTTPAAVRKGRQLYAENCAACHGESGAGNGVMAGALQDRDVPEDDAESDSGFDSQITTPADFARNDLLGASPAMLQGKILRGGMGTGMPYWGPIFTDAQTWALVDFLWSFQFRYSEEMAR